jgi:hypothetical protein
MHVVPWSLVSVTSVIYMVSACVLSRHQGDLSLRALLSGCVCTVRLWPVSVEVYDKIHVYLRRIIYDLRYI